MSKKDTVNNFDKKVVLYVDILGFKNKVKKSIQDIETFNNIKNALMYIYNVQSENRHGVLNGKQLNIQISIFSDNIIYSQPLKNDGALFYTVVSAYYLSTELTLLGFLFRGAIIIGDLYHDEKIVFGPALGKAVELEKDAVYPRIILRKEDYEYQIKNPSNSNTSEDEKKYLDYFLKKDDDGFYHIDFLSKIHDYDDKATYIEVLKKIKKIIEDGLTITDDHIRAKYLWLMNQYNSLFDSDMPVEAPSKILF